MEMPYMEAKPSDLEWKKGSAELLVLSLLEARPPHGYDVSKLIEQRSRGTWAPFIPAKPALDCGSSSYRLPPLLHTAIAQQL
jgi:hypothetical protein